MVGYWDWKAVQLHFSMFYNITSFPVKWNEKTKLFSFDFKHPIKYFAWFLNFYLVFGLGCLSSLAYVCLIKKDIPQFLVLTYAVAMALVLADLGLSVCLLLYGYESVNCLNSLILIQQDLTSLQRQENGK